MMAGWTNGGVHPPAGAGPSRQCGERMRARRG